MEYEYIDLDKYSNPQSNDQLQTYLLSNEECREKRPESQKKVSDQFACPYDLWDWTII